MHLLAQYGTYWGYVSARMPDGTAIQGFVPLKDMTLDLKADAVLSEKWTWQIISGTNGYEHDVLIGSADGRYYRYHIHLDEEGALGVYQGEAGGFYARIS